MKTNADKNLMMKNLLKTFCIALLSCLSTVLQAAMPDSVTVTTDSEKAIPEKEQTVAEREQTISLKEQTIPAKENTIPENVKVSTDPLGISVGDKLSLVLNGYAQSVYQTSNIDGDVNDFQIQRVMLIGNATVGRHLRAMVMLDVATGRADRRLHEYFLEWRQSDALQVRVGQFKQPFMLENIYIPTILGVVNMTEGTRYMSGIAGDVLQGNMVGRDIGVMLTGQAFRMKDRHHLLQYSLGLFNGAGLNQRDNNSAKDLIGMLQVFPTKNWQLTTSFIFGHGHALANSPYGNVMMGENYRRLRWSVGTEWKKGPFMLRSEHTLGWNRGVRSQAFYAEGWYRVLPKLDVVLNYDYLCKNTALTRAEREALPVHTVSHNTTVGLQYWLWRQCRIATQFVYGHRDVGIDTKQWITQFQFAF